MDTEGLKCVLCTFNRALVMMLFQRGPGFLAQLESSISLEFMLPRIYQIKEKKYSMSNVHTFTFKMGLHRL